MHMKVMNVLDDKTDSVVDGYETVKKKRNMLMVSKALPTPSFSVSYS